MDPELWADIKKVLGTTLFEVSGTAITVGAIATGVGVLFVGWILMRLIDRAIVRGLRRRDSDEGNIAVVQRLVRYLSAGVVIAMTLDVIGIPISTLFAAGAIFAVGIGFAMQNVAQNFVSGVILLIERSIKPSDVLKVEGRMVRVQQMGIRSTVALTRDEEELIIPNSILAQSTVTNYVLSSRYLRVRCQVGVTYDSDMNEVRACLEALGAELDSKRPPTVMMREFADSSVVWELSVWIDDPWEELSRRGAVMEKLWWALKGRGIVIAFPQLDVHFDQVIDLPGADKKESAAA